MYKNLSPRLLGISGRQSELIELALTYGFKSLEINLEDFVKKAQSQGVEHAGRFIRSARIKLGSCELPIKWRGEEDVYKAELEKLRSHVPSIAASGATTLHATVHPANDSFPYHENFELHRQRLAEIAGVLAEADVRLGVSFLAAPAHRADKAYQFIFEFEQLVTLVESIAHENAGLALDTWNWHFGGGTLEPIKKLGGEKVVSVSLADAPADAAAESVSDEQRLLPGVGGVIDCAAILQVLKETGFTGPVTLAPHTSGFTGMTREQIVQRCAGVLEELWVAAGFVTPKSTPTPEPAPAPAAPATPASSTSE